MKKKASILLMILCMSGLVAAELINVSVGKQATASSLWSGTNANMATDGATQADWPNYHSGAGDFDPWIMIDLERVELVKEITFWNRTQCCQVRLRDLQAEILDENQHIVYITEIINPGNILGITDYSIPSITYTLENSVPGQYVRVRRIPYETTGDANNHDGYILCLNELQVFADGEAASIAGAPSPYYGEANVPLEVTLSWDASVLDDPNDEDPPYPNPDLVQHNLYMSGGKMSDPNLILVAEIPAGDARVGYGPIAIERDGVYYWRVDEVVPDANDPGENKVITGGLWQFYALSSSPGIDPATPAEQIIDDGANAVFTVSATNPFTGDSTGLSYEWFKVDAAGDILVGDNSDTLALVTPTADDEGDYYCIVTVVINGNKATSNSANLTIKRLIHHWPFEGDMEDIVGGRDGVAVGDPDLSIEGISGNYAVDLDANDAIHIPGDPLELDSYSISVWVSHRGLPNDFHSVIHQDGWANYGASGSLHWHLRSDKSFSWGINGAGGDGRTAANVIPQADRWYHLVLSYRFGLARAYVDGLLVDEVMAATPIRSRMLPGTLGAWLNGASNERFINGRIDDLRIYNYPLDDIDIALLNYEATGIPVCVTKPEMDLNGDCRTTLEDVAILAANWMACNRVPLSACD
ncbi:MAG: discoidin domain-containing protein [Sedimentisphaerales bacterium]|nr:discoidin domain-containing protein [Sedimentisphaerales bacterium]